MRLPVNALFRLGAAFVPSLAAVLCLAASAHAQIVDSEPQYYEAPPTERRGGFVLGLSAGAGFGSAVGYPNQLGEIDNPDFRQSVGGFSTGNSVWIGGGLRDWLTFAVSFGGQGAGEGELLAVNQSFGVRVEGFPLYFLGGIWRDIGVLGNFGAGGSQVTDESEKTVADGGIMSVIGLGVFYEPWQFWQFSAGPQLDYTHQFSESLSSHTVTIGLRMALYGAQP